MHRIPLLLALGFATLWCAGCAGGSSAGLSGAAPSDDPPVTISGYVDTSTTARFR